MGIDTATLYDRSTGEAQEFPILRAQEMARTQPAKWSFEAPLPAGWDRQLPRYRIMRDLNPPVLDRVRLDPPLSTESENVWQYGQRPLEAGEVIVSPEWPHPSMRPLNTSAKQVMQFFTSRPRSRMSRCPWMNGRVVLDDGMGVAEPTVSRFDRLRSAQPQTQEV